MSSELTEFLLARIAEDERTAHYALSRDGALPTDADWGGWWLGHYQHYSRQDPARVLAECEAKRHIVEFHKAWPVLVQGPAEFTRDDASDDLSSVAFRMAQQMDWLTAQQFRQRFGEEPPTAPMLAVLAAVYADHPDYRQEWRP